MVNSLVGHVTVPAFRIYHFLWEAADWLFPPNCAGCGCFGYRWCPSCAKNIQKINPPFCQICNQLVTSTRICDNCLNHPPAFTELRSLGNYTGALRKAILRMKFANNQGISEVFARDLLCLVKTTEWNPDMIVAVPLAKQHLISRGYNQAELLARPLSWGLGIPYSSAALSRIKQTSYQVGLNAEQRKENMQRAFWAQAEVIQEKTILLVDDIATTCATLIECSIALLAAGAKQVYAVTLARAMLSQDIPYDLIVTGDL